MYLKKIILCLAACLMLLAIPALGETYVCDEQGFSFEYDPAYTAQWEDGNGVVIYTETPDSIPYAIVWCGKRGDTSNIKAEDLIARNIEKTKERHGDNLLSVEEGLTLNMGDDSIPGVCYTYKLNEYTIELMVFYQITEDSVRQFTAKYVVGEGDATVAAMGKAISSFQFTETKDLQSEPITAPQTAYQVAPAEPVLGSISQYDGGYFSIDLPQGWKIQTMGAYSTFGFRAWNPKNQDYEIFFYGALSPFNKSEAAKEWNKRYASTGDITYTMLAGAPVVNPDCVEELFCVWGEFVQYYENNRNNPFFMPDLSFPSLKNFGVIEKLPMNSLFSGFATDEALVRGSFQSALGTNCYAKCAANLCSAAGIIANGMDVAPQVALNVSGVLAPQEYFYEIEEVLTNCLSSLQFSEEYIRQGIESARQMGETAMATNAELQAAFDSSNDAWERRQLSYDASAQAYSDAALGYERLYDPDTGEVYRAELGFYDTYDTNRSILTNTNLQLVDSDRSNYYLQGVDYYIGK